MAFSFANVFRICTIFANITAIWIPASAGMTLLFWSHHLFGTDQAVVIFRA